MDEDIAKFARWIYDNDRNLGENFYVWKGQDLLFLIE